MIPAALLVDAWAVAAIAAVVWVLGRAIDARLAFARGAVERWLAGLVALHLLLQLADRLHIPWGAGLLLVVGLSAALVPLFGRRRSPGPRRRVLDRADLLVALLLVAVAWAALALWAPLSDFVYHWGVKGHRFALARGVDWQYLAWPESGIFHPDYPLLVPELVALTTLLLGRFSEPVLMLWSVLFLALIAAAGREALRAAGVERTIERAGTVLVAAAAIAFALAYAVLGGPEPLIALALLAGGTRLATAEAEGEAPIGRIDRAGLGLGVCAALAASSKIEGIPLALLLLVLWLWRRRAVLRRQPIAVSVAPLLPLGAVLGLWAAGVLQYGLLQENNARAVDPGRLLPVVETALRLLFVPAWFGLAPVVLLLPLLLVTPRARPWAMIAGAQLLVYLGIYLVSPHEPVAYVISNFPRLLLHVVPATWVAALVALDALGRGDPVGAEAQDCARAGLGSSRRAPAAGGRAAAGRRGW